MTPIPRSTAAGAVHLRSSTALAFAFVLFLVSGRWNLNRVVTIDGSVLTAPRGWLVAAVLFIALLPVLRRHPQRALPPLAFCSFVSYFIVSVGWAPDVGVALTKAIDLGVMAIGVLALRRLVLRVGVHETTAQLSVIFGYVFGALAIGGLVSSMLSGGARLSLLGGGPNVYGRNMGVLLVVCLGMLLRNRQWRPGPLAGVVLAGLLIVLTGSRGALAASLIGAGGLVYMRQIQVSRTVAVIAAATVSLTVIALWTDVGQAAVASFEHRVTQLTFEQNYDSGRGQLRDAAFSMIARSPWIGDGLNGFRARGHGVYPHNLELEALTDGGLAGLLILLAVLALPCFAIATRNRAVDPMTCGLFLLHLTSAQVSGDFYDSRGVFLFGMLLSLQLTAPRDHTQRSLEDNRLPPPR